MVYNGAGLVFSQGAVLTVQTLVAPTITAASAERHHRARRAGRDVRDHRRHADVRRADCSAGMEPHGRRRRQTSLAEQQRPGLLFHRAADSSPTTARSTASWSTIRRAKWPATRHRDRDRRRAAGITTTTLASRATSGATANNRSGLPSLSADGNIVAFISDGTNLVPGFGGYPLASSNAYVRNLATGVTTLVNVTPAGTQSQSTYGVIGLKSPRAVATSSSARSRADLVADDTNGSQDVFVRDLQTGTTTASQPASRWHGDQQCSATARATCSSISRPTAVS